MQQNAAIATNRFGLGARPGELARVAPDPRGWLRAQLSAGGVPAVPEGSSRLADSATILRRAAELRRERRDARGASSEPAAPASGDVVGIAQRLGALLRPIYLDEAAVRFEAARRTDRPFVERLVQFWSNHFAVSIDKLAVLGIAGAFEREAIRPNVLGRFEDLLLAVERHPAMLLYLDNHLSIGPRSRIAELAARRGARATSGTGAGAARRIGINENLAREILELHTLGVGGGYTQADVTSFAHVISGWSIGGEAARVRARLAAQLGDDDPSRAGHFLFREAFHEPGAQTLLGRRYAQEGLAQGEAVLRDLAAAPQTARHLATKLARHFVADDPPVALIERLAAAYQRSKGDLPSVYRALIDSEEAWAEPLAKFKTPSDYVHSTSRALDLPAPRDARSAVAPFELLGQRPFSPGSPAGWPDRAADWDGSSALMKRLEWADAVGRRVGNLRRAAELAPQVLGSVLTEPTRLAITRAESGAQAVTLLLAAPEFMRR